MTSTCPNCQSQQFAELGYESFAYKWECLECGHMWHFDDDDIALSLLAFDDVLRTIIPELPDAERKALVSEILAGNDDNLFA